MQSRRQAWTRFCERAVAGILFILSWPTIVVIYLILLPIAGDPAIITDSIPAENGAVRKSFRFRTTGPGEKIFHGFGRWLRKYGFDELPALWSVTRGDARLRDVLPYLTTTGRAYLTLLRADRFAVGPIGAAARISRPERALAVLLRERATDMFLDLLEHATLPGQLYALLGLSVSDYGEIGELLAKYRQRTDEVQTQTACLGSLQPVRNVVARIEDGTYSIQFPGA
jgi:hypothetical protein